MSKHILENLFNSRTRVKVLKVIFRNYPNDFGVREVARRVTEPLGSVKREMRLLQKLGVVRKFTKKAPRTRPA